MKIFGVLLVAFSMLSVSQPVMAKTKEEPKVLPVFCTIGSGKYRTSGFLCEVELVSLQPEVELPKWNCHLGRDRFGRVQEFCVLGL